VIHNALTSTDRVEVLFPEGHPLHRLVRPTFDTIRRTFRGIDVTTIWVDEDYDPKRAGFRPSYDKIYGPGAALLMTFVASWLSTGAGEHAEGNRVLVPAGIDRTLIAYAQRIGLLGEVAYVGDKDDFERTVLSAGRKLYSIDDMGPHFDAHALVGSELSLWLNGKAQLSTVTAYAPSEVVKDMYDVTPADFEAAQRGAGRVFLKTCNTESAGAGVFIAHDLDEFERHLAAIRDKQRAHDLDRRLVIQPEIKGKNRSFQVLLDPSDRAHLQVVALTDQLVEADGKTYKASINHPITADNLEQVGPAILDMVDRVWARFPRAFGFLMSDYFETEQGPVLFDPGIRPTGNTATALAFHLARKLTGADAFASLFTVATRVDGLTFEGFLRVAGRLADPESLLRDGRCVLPWGWNAIQGFGMLIGIAPDQAAFEALRAEVLALPYAR
jgi:hypothetical protein